MGWYYVFVSRDTEALRDAFEHLPVEEKRTFTQEVLRRSLPFDSGPLEGEEIGAASSGLFGETGETGTGTIFPIFSGAALIVLNGKCRACPGFCPDFSDRALARPPAR